MSERFTRVVGKYVGVIMGSATGSHANFYRPIDQSEPKKFANLEDAARSVPLEWPVAILEYSQIRRMRVSGRLVWDNHTLTNHPPDCYECGEVILEIKDFEPAQIALAIGGNSLEKVGFRVAS